MPYIRDSCCTSLLMHQYFSMSIVPLLQRELGKVQGRLLATARELSVSESSDVTDTFEHSARQ